MGCFLSFISTFTLSSGVKMSWIAESLIQYAMYRAELGHAALLIRAAPLHSLRVGFVADLLNALFLDHTDSPGQDLMSLPTTTHRSPSLLGFCHAGS